MRKSSFKELKNLNWSMKCDLVKNPNTVNAMIAARIQQGFAGMAIVGVFVNHIKQRNDLIKIFRQEIKTLNAVIVRRKEVARKQTAHRKNLDHHVKRKFTEYERQIAELKDLWFDEINLKKEAENSFEWCKKQADIPF